MTPTTRPPSPIPQPFLHDLVTCVSAPTVVLSGQDGQVRSGSVQGAFRHDRRIVSRLIVDVDGHEPVAVGHGYTTGGGIRFVSVVRHLGDPTADPTVRLERTRHARADGFEERLELVNASRQAVTARVRLRVAVDLAAMDAVKHGETTAALSPRQPDGDSVTWGDPHTVVTLRAGGDPELATGGEDPEATVTWQVDLPARAHWTADVTVTALDRDPAAVGVFAAAKDAPVPEISVTGPVGLAPLVAQSMADLCALRLTDPHHPDDVFAAAGSPWFLTLFGRDSLWTARFALPLGTGLARGTLRTLARRQGTRHDPVTGEAPGKIPHEVRTSPQRASGGHLVYFGTVDATALWVCLLHDAWRWGMPESDVADLLEPLRAALRWLVEDADADGDGFLEYLNRADTGLANQGWKDSGDAIQFSDGTIASPPIALCEAQAYAYQAATGGADLLEAFGQPGADQLREWAAQLRERFRGAFWVEDARGRFPAIALEGAKRPVDVATSNVGHLLGTGLLTTAEAAAIAARLAEPDLNCGYGLRTLTADAAGFNPLGYHVGTVWPHDTAIAVGGLVREGLPQAAEELASGVLRAAPTFGYRLPELYAGMDASGGQPPMAYPAACRPQAWSAAAVVALLQAALGLRADVPRGVLTVQPCFPSWFPLRVTGLRLAGHPLSVSVDADGTTRVETTAPVEVHVTRPAADVPRPRPAETAAATGAGLPDGIPAPGAVRP
jgi:glycogen debranching enzyme